MNSILTPEGVEQKSLAEYTEHAYLNYSMYVILDRALPHVGDGLKPVQRRIIYAMSELGLTNSAKFKKSARTVGDVLGKFHPHGDSACYEAMVLMAQPFSYRYPLIEGQGNWGSTDEPKSFAAMRYTESRLSNYANILLSELEQGTVNWLPNFDSTMKEPNILPARLPNLLLNGTTGIAVGMATDIPPHNMHEIIQACVYLLDNPSASTKDLMNIVRGPDFPTCAEIITSKEKILDIYQQGKGTIKLRATYVKEQESIVINTLPYQCSGSKVIDQIAQQMQQKKISMISDIRDESDAENPTRIVIQLKSNQVDIKDLMSHLFATTDLEKSCRINMNVIGLDGRPRVMSLDHLLKEWLSWRNSVVRAKLNYRREKISHRLHYLSGLLIAFLNIDDVIEIIRNEDKPKPIFMEKYNLSEIQVDAILDIKLRQLAKLEEVKIKQEQKELESERSKIEKYLLSKNSLKSLIKEELISDNNFFQDKRQSVLAVRDEAKSFSEIEFVSDDPVTVVVSEKGWIRSANGHQIDPKMMSYKSSDRYLFHAQGKTDQACVVVDSFGKSYAIDIHTLPSSRGQGEPLTGRISPQAGAFFSGLCIADHEQRFLICTDAGYGFLVQFSDMMTKNKKGKSLITLTENAKIINPILVNNDCIWVAVITNEGRMLVFSLDELPKLVKGKGNKMINISSSKTIDKTEVMSFVVVFNSQQSLILHAGKRHLKIHPNDLSYFISVRGRRGNKLPRGLQKITSVEVC